uniref:Putative conserved secreted protein n=1 Tax=Ixodes ricinus TaxID=34613 RepID=A0A6B0UL76_IXORI
MKLAAGVIIVALLLLLLEEGPNPCFQEDISSEFIPSGLQFPHMPSSEAKKLRASLNKKCGYPRFTFTEINFKRCRYQCRGIGTDRRTVTLMLDDGTPCGRQGESCKGGHCVAQA